MNVGQSNKQGGGSKNKLQKQQIYRSPSPPQPESSNATSAVGGVRQRMTAFDGVWWRMTAFDGVWLAFWISRSDLVGFGSIWSDLVGIAPEGTY